METERDKNCQFVHAEEMFAKDPIGLRINLAIVAFLRKIKFYLYFRKVKYFLGFRTHYSGASAPPRLVAEPKPQVVKKPTGPLKQGDWVRIKSKEEILKTVDENNKLEGCVVMPEMWQYCGTETRVVKRVEYFLDEANYKMRKMRTTVLLEGLHCSGKMPGYKAVCDRNCFFFWKEAWLDKIEAPAEEKPEETDANRQTESDSTHTNLN
jgi:hypothetical protein